MTASLTPKERVVLMTLMALNAEVSNAVLKERAGLTLEGQARVRLNELRLVDSRRPGRSYLHSLSEQGWAWCRDEVGRSAPSRADTGTRGLYAVLAGLRRHLDARNLSLADVFGADVPEALAHRIRAAYGELATVPGDWVSITALRKLLDGAARDVVDETLRRMEGEPDVFIAPDPDQGRLTPADRSAAVRIGGKDKHLLKVDVG